MKHQGILTILVLGIILMSSVAAAYGIFSRQGPGAYEFKSIFDQTVKIYGKGLYRHDSVSMAAQAKAQDSVTLMVGVPLLALSFLLSRKGLLKGRLLLAGTLGYFLYAYASYSFLSMYNSFYLIYVALFSAGIFAFILTMVSFNLDNLGSYFHENTPVKFIGGFLLFVGVSVLMMWLGRIVPPLINGTVPVELGHYTTLVIQSLDLGIVVPVTILAGVLIIKKRPLGYLLSAVMVLKGITMLTSISAMIIGMKLAGEDVSLIEMLLFPLFNIIGLLSMVLILKNIIEPNKPIKKEL